MIDRRTLSRSCRAFFLLMLIAGAALPVRAELLAGAVREEVLANGMRLLLVQRDASPTFTAYITIGVGGVDESSRERGAAHLLEHMLFKGTRSLGTTDYEGEQPLLEKIEAVASRLDLLRQSRDPDPKQLSKLEEELSALQKRHKKYVVKDEFSSIYAQNGGVGYNAFTSKDLTTYTISLPANKMELWAAIESDRLKNAVLREFYTEREVVREERRRSYESSPRGMLYETLLANAFTVHPYRNPIIGWDSDIATLSLAETRRFLNKYYAPVNTVIALVGDIDHAGVEALVERYFGDIAPGVPVPEVTEKEPPQRGEKRVRADFDAEQQLAIAFHKPTLPERDDYVFDLIDQILSQGRTSRLYRGLVLEQQLVTSVSTYGAPGARYDNLFVISAMPRHPHDAAEVEEAIYAELERLATEPVPEAELEKARVQLRTGQLRRLRSNTDLARMLTYYETVAGSWRYLADYDEQVASIGAEEIMAVARRYFTPSNRTVAILGRKDER